MVTSPTVQQKVARILLTPPSLPLIWTPCTTYFERQKRLFKRHSKCHIIQNSS